MGAPLPSFQIDKVAPIGRRAAPRLRLSIPARFLSLYGSRPCVLINLSRSGALVGVEEPLRLNEGAVLSFAGFERFGLVARQRGGLNAFEFEDDLTNEEVLAVRTYSERYQDDERRELQKSVAAWVGGEDSL